MYDGFDFWTIGRFLRNETDNKTHWDTTNNNTRLDDRVIAIDNWKTTLERTLKDLDLEIDALTMAKKVLLNTVRVSKNCKTLGKPYLPNG